MILKDFIQTAQTRLDTIFKSYLVQPKQPAIQLQDTITYAAFNGGKHIRPSLVYLTGRALQASWENLDSSACAIELIHIYSLIHDDLPSMDNADLRRGKPACHKAFGEAMAILAGDALQPLAFEIIATHPDNLTPEQRLNIITILSRASGAEGMAAGQALDLLGTSSLDSLTRMYQLKTGALLNASVQAGAISANMQDQATLLSLKIFAENLGLAFQIQDDLLDIEGTPQTTGKPQGIDAANQKITFPALIGVEESRRKVQDLTSTALNAITCLGQSGQLLNEFATLLLTRKN
ncbi:MAG: farnesyl diphosphate synthase [Gammaproteobacteria bacterium]